MTMQYLFPSSSARLSASTCLVLKAMVKLNFSSRSSRSLLVLGTCE